MGLFDDLLEEDELTQQPVQPQSQSRQGGLFDDLLEEDDIAPATQQPAAQPAYQYDPSGFRRKKPVAAEPKPEEQGILRQVADIPLGIARGSVTGIKMMTDILGADNAVSKSLAGVEGYMADLMSAQAKEDQQEISRIMKDAEDKGFGEQVKAGIKAFSIAPVDIMSQALGTMAPVIATGLAGSAAKLGALGMRAVQAGVGAGMGAGMIKGEIYNEVKNELVNSGIAEDAAEKAAVDAQSYGGKNLDQILLGAGLGAASTLGAEGIITRILTKQGTAPAAGVVSRVLKGGLTEAAPEAAQAAQEQLAKNVALQREGFDVDPSRGVVAAATMEAVAAAPLGGIAGAVEKPAPIKTLAEENLEQTNEIARKVAENGAPLTASAIQDQAATNLRQDELAKQLEAQLEEELVAVKKPTAAAQKPMSKDEFKAIYSQVAPEELDAAEAGFTEQAVTDATEEGRISAQNALEAIKEVKATVTPPAPTVEPTITPAVTPAVPAAQPTITDATQEIIQPEGVRQEPQDGTQVQPTEETGVGRSILGAARGQEEGQVVPTTQPTISEIPPTSELVGAEPTQPTIREVPEISPIVGAEPAAIVEQEPVATAEQPFTTTTGDAGIDAKITKTETMSPDEYLKKAWQATDGKLGGSYEEWLSSNMLTDADRAKYSQAMMRGDKFPLPYIDKYGGSQDGRNRALAAKEAGIQAIPIGIIEEPSVDVQIQDLRNELSITKSKIGRSRIQERINKLESPAPVETPAITPAPVEEVEFAELNDLMDRRGQAQGKVKGVKFSKKDEARYNELLPKYRSRLLETITPEADPVVWKDIQGNDIKVSQKGTFYTVENGRVRTGPAFQSEVFIEDVNPQPVAAAVVESNNIELPEGYTKQGDVYVYQAPVAETPAAPAAEPAGKPEEVAPTPSPKEVSAIETPTTTNLRNKIKEAKGKDRQIVVMQAMADESFFSSAIEAAEFGKPFPSIGDTKVDDKLPDSIPQTIDTSKIKLPPIKAKSPEVAVSPMISYDDGRWVLGGVYFDSTNNMVVATDGRALVAIPQKVTGGDKIVAERNIKKQGIKKGDLIEGNYPNWKQVVPTYGKDIQKVDIDIDDALKASTILDSINNTFNNKVGSSLIVFNDAKFDPKYILSSITALVESGAKSITAQIKSEVDPLLLTGDNGAIAVVMPKRVTGRIVHQLKSKTEAKPAVKKYNTQALLNAAKPFSEYGSNYNRNIAASYERLKSSIEKGSLESTIAYNAEELQIRLNKFEPEALANAMQEQIAPAGISVGNRIKLGKSPQTYIVEEVVPQSEVEKENGDQFYSVKNERTGETQVVEARDLKQVKGKGARKIAAATRNEEYMRLAQNPEANREQLQRMVDEAAKVAGYNVGPVLHGTSREFNVFDKQKRGATGTSAAAKAFWFTTDEITAKNFSKLRTGAGGGSRIIRAYLKGEFAKSDFSDIPNWNTSVSHNKRRDTVQRAIKNGKDGVHFIKMADFGPAADAYAVFEPSQIKSADPVTYDDAGNVIPLEERFQPTSPDIRRQAIDTTPEGILTTPPDQQYTFNEVFDVAYDMFGGEIPEGFTIVNDSKDKDFEFKAAYIPESGEIIVNLAYLNKSDDIRDTITHELGHYIFGDPEFRAAFDQFIASLSPEARAELDAYVETAYNKETGEIRLEEKMVRAFVDQFINEEQAPAWRSMLDAIKRFLNKLGFKFNISDRDAISVFTAALDRYKAGEAISREGGARKIIDDLTAMDAEYLAVVERGDMETAQRMVNEAASKNPLLELALSASATDINAFNSDEEYISYWEKLSPEAFEETDRERLNIANDVADNAYGNFLEDAKKLGATSDEFIQLVQDATYKQNDFSPSKKDAKLNVIPLSQRFRPTSPDIRRMAAEPRREQVAGMKIGRIITTPPGITQKTTDIIRNKFFDSTKVSPENTSQAWAYISQFMDKTDNNNNKFAGYVNQVTEEELAPEFRKGVEESMGASLFSVELANYAGRLAVQGDTKMLAYMIRNGNKMPTGEFASGVSQSGRVLNAFKKRLSSDISGVAAYETELESNVERLAAVLFGTNTPSKEQIKIAQDALTQSESAELDLATEVADDINRIESRTNKGILQKIDDFISGYDNPKKDQLLLIFANLIRSRDVDGITISYKPAKFSISDRIANLIVKNLANYRDTLVDKAASGLESTFWRTMSSQENKPGLLGELDQAQNNELAKIVKATLIKMKLAGEPKNTKMTDIEKVASILNESKLSEEKRIEADKRIVEEIDRRRQEELSTTNNPDAVNAKYDSILKAWNDSMSRQLNMPVSDSMLQRLISSEMKEQDIKIRDLVDEADGKVVVEKKQNIINSIIRKIYGVSKESETGIEMDENYDGLKSYLEQTLDNMYALSVEEKNAAYAKRQAQISLRNTAESQAQSIINRLADQLSDTPAFPEKQENEVKAIVQQDLKQIPDMNRKQPWTSQLTAKLMRAGVSETQAQIISDLVWRQHEIKAMDRESKELQTAAEKGSLAVIIDRIKNTPLEKQQSPEWKQEVIKEYLRDAGLSSKAAETAAKLYDSVISERLAAAKQKAFEDTLAKAAPWNNYASRNGKLAKDALKKIRDAIRTGVLDPEKNAESIIAAQSGWTGFTKEQYQRIVELDTILNDPNQDDITKREAMFELNKIITKAKMPVRFKDALGAYYIGNALMGIPTALVNIVSPISFSIRNLMVDIAKYTKDNPAKIPVAFETFLDSMRSWYNQTSYAFKNQIYLNDVVEYLNGQNVLRETFDKGKKQWAEGKYAEGFANMAVGMTQITGRVLSALDQGAISMLENQNITRYAMAALENAKKKVPKDKIVEFANMTLDLKRRVIIENIAAGMDADRAGVLADLAVKSELRAALSEYEADTQSVLDSAINDALQSVGRNKVITIEGIERQQKDVSDSGILSYWPIKMLETVSRGAGSEGSGMQIFSKMVYGFALVPARTFHTAAWFSPYGFLRLAIDKYKTNKGQESPYAMSLQTEAQYRQRLTESIAGSIAMLGLFALRSGSSDEDEDKKFKIVITGNGPNAVTDKQYYDSWIKKYKPYSINIVLGDTVIPINIGRGGEALFFPIMLAGALDDYEIKSKQNLTKKEPDDLNAATEMLGSAFFALAQRGPYAAFTEPLFDASKQGRVTENLVSQLGYFGKTFVPVLGASITRNISDIINDPVDRSSIEGAIYANTPIIGPWVGTKALNALGQPIRADDWGDKLYKLGVPVVFSFPKNTPENELNELILKQGGGPTIPTRANAQKRFGDVLTSKEFETYVREYGRVMSDKMFKNRTRLANMKSADYDDELEKYARGYSIDGIKIKGASDSAVLAVKRMRQ